RAIESISPIHVFLPTPSRASPPSLPTPFQISHGSSCHAKCWSPAARERQRGVHCLWQYTPSPPGHPPSTDSSTTLLPIVATTCPNRKTCRWSANPARTIIISLTSFLILLLLTRRQLCTLLYHINGTCDHHN